MTEGNRSVGLIEHLTLDSSALVSADATGSLFPNWFTPLFGAKSYRTEEGVPLDAQVSLDRLRAIVGLSPF